MTITSRSTFGMLSSAADKLLHLSTDLDRVQTPNTGLLLFPAYAGKSA
ncbi:hypothetical protein [Sphingobacterium kitahiroshimense]|uniref:Uncharacterized protein n=1 Tax=Sphingobacterium kitahiroshimense TaxID=470446 RepID=A0ABV0BZM4_9SPHI